MMNTPDVSTAEPGAARRPLHPLVAAAAVAVIVLCATGVAALTGLLPRPWAQSAPEAAVAAGEPPAAGAGPTAAAAAPAAAAVSSAPRASAAPAASAACAECGTVVSVRQLQVPAGRSGPNIIGAVAGGVVGGVVGNQFGGGHGREALTLLGAAGGALAGHEIERNIRGQQTVTRHEMSVRMADGSLRTFRSDAPFALAAGDAVRVENGRAVPLY